jgi:purine-cytosine permease-like protein
MNGFDIKGGSFAYFLNMIGGIILSEYFFKKNFPNDNYEYKKIWKALLISIAVTVPFLLAMIFAPAE